MEKGVIQNLGRTLLSNVRPFFFLKKTSSRRYGENDRGTDGGKKLCGNGGCVSKKSQNRRKKSKIFLNVICFACGFSQCTFGDCEKEPSKERLWNRQGCFLKNLIVIVSSLKNERKKKVFLNAKYRQYLHALGGTDVFWRATKTSK